MTGSAVKGFDGKATAMKANAQHRDETRGGRKAPGTLSILEFYTIEEAKSRLGWTDSALRAAKRRGLKLLASGKRRYVTGREILRFLQAEATPIQT
jgi:hypothetical protein